VTTGSAILCVWNDVDPAIEDDYNDWYLREHIPERLAVPGMLRGRRYRADEGSPRYMAIYETETISVLTSGVYRAQLANPTAWTRRVMPGFRLMQRGICNVVASVGAGIGGAATVLHLRPEPGGELALAAWAQVLLAALLAQRQIAAAHIWSIMPGEPGSPTTALTRNSATERGVDWVVMIEGSDAAAVETARSTALNARPTQNGAAAVLAYPTYQLLYAQSVEQGNV
jgi:hypothetical protein